MATAAERKLHQLWLEDITALPTAAGHEDRIIAYIEGWVKARKNLQLERDGAGNLIISRKGGGRTGQNGAPIYITAHLDHPAFVIIEVKDGKSILAEFRGGVHDPYFDGAAVECFDEHDNAYPGKITHLNNKARPFKQVDIMLNRATDALRPGHIGRWKFRGPLPRTTRGLFHTWACDDLAAVAAALSVMDVIRQKRTGPDVRLLFTRAEEVGFIGTLAVCLRHRLPEGSRLICLENSRSFAESPIGGGPILRVGDRMSVFSPELTNRLSDLMIQHKKANPEFMYQRKLMPGGACEATAFATFGYEATCVCLPLGNYHNMVAIDEVQAGDEDAKVGPEFISLDDYHGLIELLRVAVMKLDEPLDEAESSASKLENLFQDRSYILDR